MFHRSIVRARIARLGLISLLAAAAIGCASIGAETIEAPSTPAEELRFADFFVLPVGPRGLEPTPRLKSLSGRRVRIEGYPVKEEEPYPGLFMLTPVPVALADRADGPSDFLPPATLYVHLPEAMRDVSLHLRRAPLVVTGTLELGAREEVNGRFSTVRLRVDDAPDSLFSANPDMTDNSEDKGAIE